MNWSSRKKKESVFCTVYFIRINFLNICVLPQRVFRGSKVFSRGYFVSSNFFLVDISWVQSFFSWVFHGFEIFSRGLWVQNIFAWVFRGSHVFSRGYFAGPNFFLVGISWVQDFFTWVFRRSKILGFSINFSKKQKERYGWGILTESFK